MDGHVYIFSLPTWDSSFQHSLSFCTPSHRFHFLSTKPGQLLTNPARMNLFYWPWQDPRVASFSFSVCMLFHSGQNPADIQRLIAKKTKRQALRGKEMPPSSLLTDLSLGFPLFPLTFRPEDWYYFGFCLFVYLGFLFCLITVRFWYMKTTYPQELSFHCLRSSPHHSCPGCRSYSISVKVVPTQFEEVPMLPVAVVSFLWSRGCLLDELLLRQKTEMVSWNLDTCDLPCVCLGASAFVPASETWEALEDRNIFNLGFACCRLIWPWSISSLTFGCAAEHAEGKATELSGIWTCLAVEPHFPCL